MSKSTKYDSSEYNTLAHELIAKEEQNVFIFFVAYAIQFYMTKDIIQNEIKTPFFISDCKDIELYASQRVFIKKILSNPKYKNINKELENLFLTNDGAKKLDTIFFNKLNKAFLIRQIFKQTDQVLQKYQFIDNFIDLEFYDIDLNELLKEMKHLTIKEQILVLVRVFSNIKDMFENKKKTIGTSFLENINRIKQDCIRRNNKNTLEYANLERFYLNFK